jgi:hypothetical protein
VKKERNLFSEKTLKLYLSEIEFLFQKKDRVRKKSRTFAEKKLEKKLENSFLEKTPELFLSEIETFFRKIETFYKNGIRV